MRAIKVERPIRQFSFKWWLVSTLGPFEAIYTEPLFDTNNDALTSPRVASILATSAGDAAIGTAYHRE
jgi:hypothetical protein